MKNIINWILPIVCMQYCLNASDINYSIRCHLSDVYLVKDYHIKSSGVCVLIHDWYEDQEHWHFCPYTADWCYPELYPTLAVRYGKKIDEKDID